MTGARPPRVALFDIDGVLTDGAIYVGADGRELRKILYDDIDAYFALRREGYAVGFITGEKGPFDRYYKRRFAPDVYVSGCRDKLAAYERLARRYGWRKEETVFVGDSPRDAALLGHVKFGLAPRDAAPEARQAARAVLPVRRGQGVVRETRRWLRRVARREEAK